LRDERLVIIKSIIGLLIIAIIGGAILNWSLIFSTYFVFLSTKLKFLTLFVCFIGGFIGYFFSFTKFLFFNKSFKNYIFSLFSVGI
jgi:hypothetical protein